MFGLRPVTFQKRRSNRLRDWPHDWYLAHNYLQGDTIPSNPSMVWVEGDTFRMGSDRHYPEEAPVHRVTVDGFWIDRTPVTNAQIHVMGLTSWRSAVPSKLVYPRLAHTENSRSMLSVADQIRAIDEGSAHPAC